MAWISGGSAEVILYSGDSGTLTLESAPEAYESPVSIEESHAQGEEVRDINGIEGNEIDDPEIDTESDFALSADGDSETEEGPPT
jgi:hypothetical protein